MILGLFGYYPWHYGVLDFLDLGIETLAFIGDLVTLIDILSGVLEVYLKTLGCLFVLCACYYDYMLCLWLGIHLYTTITLPNFYEDLIHLRLGIPKRFSIFACWFQPKGWEYYIDSWCQVLASYWLYRSFP